MVVNSDQQIRSTPSGMLNVFTTVDMSAEHGSKRKTSHAEQEMHLNFTLPFSCRNAQRRQRRFL